MNGDGKTDFVIVRGTGSAFTNEGLPKPRFIGARGRASYEAASPNSLSSPSVVQEYWYTQLNTTGVVTVTAWGDAITDWNIPADFDGDGKDDIAVWRAGSAGSSAFYIINSFNSTFRFVQMGESGNDPSIVADYDGDGKDDPAIFSCPVSPPGACTFSYVGSLNNPSGTVTNVSWGSGTIFTNSPIPGDYDGDGKADFCVYIENPSIPGQGRYALHKSGPTADEFVDWGLYNSDIVVPGDFDGDGKADFMIIRTSGGSYYHFLLTRTGNFTVTNWGITGDIPIPGDYDGDRKTDIAVWRPSAVPNQSLYFAILSGGGGAQVVSWGQCSIAPCDEPVADWQVH